MTTTDVLALAAWPPCPIQLPAEVSLGAHGTITDVPRHLATQVARLDSPCPLLRALARESLDTFITRAGLRPV